MRPGTDTPVGGPGAGKIAALFLRLWGDLFLRTLLVVGVGLVVVGGGATYALRFPIESSVREEAVRDIVVTVRPLILKRLSPEHLAQPMTGARYEEVDQMIRDHALGPHVARLKLWNPAGMVVYSTLRAQIGDSYPENEHLQQALQGSTVWEVSRETESPQERALRELMEIYVPLTWEPSGTPAGVLEVYLLYAPYARHLASIRNALFAAVGLVSLVLGAALYLMYRSGWASLHRERDIALQRQREVAALNRLLQQDLAHYFELRDRLLELQGQLLQDPRFQPDVEPIPARDTWLLMQIRELAEFAGDLRGPGEQQPENRESSA